ASELLRAPAPHLGELVGQHDHGAADHELGVADLAVGTTHAHALGGAQDLLVEVDGLRGAVDDEIRGDDRVTVRDGLDLVAHISTSVRSNLQTSTGPGAE